MPDELQFLSKKERANLKGKDHKIYLEWLKVKSCWREQMISNYRLLLIIYRTTQKYGVKLVLDEYQKNKKELRID